MFYIGVNLQEENLVRVEIVEYSRIVLVDFVLYCFEGEQLSIGRLEEGLCNIGVTLPCIPRHYLPCLAT